MRQIRRLFDLAPAIIMVLFIAVGYAGNRA
jgi:hypothetical protein